MTTHVEHGTIRPPGFSLFGKITAAVAAWRAATGAPKALEPGSLDDTGIGQLKSDEPPDLVPVVNPYALVVAAFFSPRRMDRGER